MDQILEIQQSLSSKLALLNSPVSLGISSQYKYLIFGLTLGLMALNLIVGGIVGKDTGKVSANFRIKVVPPPIFFSIWAVIYLCFIIAAIGNCFINEWSFRVHLLFDLNSILLALWVFIFSFNHQRANELCLLVLAATLVVSELQWSTLVHSLKEEESSWSVFCMNAFAFYQGWIIAAFNLNMGLLLVFSLGIPKKIHLGLFWIVCPICYYYFISRHLELTTVRNTFGLFLSMAWALVGATISSIRNIGQDITISQAKYH